MLIKLSLIRQAVQNYDQNSVKFLLFFWSGGGGGGGRSLTIRNLEPNDVQIIKANIKIWPFHHWMNILHMHIFNF